MKPFLTLAAPGQHREEVKDSVFLAYAGRADSQDEAFAFLREVLGRHTDASHLCWAYRIGDGYRYSDGGEPTGTAGQPILRTIEGQGLDHVVVGVIRYFGDRRAHV
jgi:putative IMPACT (imprinted ancient) family translation regulator